MSKYRIAVIVGSLRKDSHNRRLAHALTRLGAPEFEFHYPRIDDLPLYNQDDDDNPAPQVTRLREEIKAADAVLFATAEYNRSIPGVLKNAIDHASRPWGKSVWGGKPVGVVGVSVGAAGTCMAQQHLRNVISYLNMPQFGQPEMFIQWKEGLVKDGAIGPDSKDFVQKYVDTFAAWVKKQVG